MKISTSFCRNFLQSFFMSSGIVALNIITCFWWGVLTKIYWMSDLIRALPNTLSHSSITKNLHWVSWMGVHFLVLWTSSWPTMTVAPESQWWYADTFISILSVRAHYLQLAVLHNSNHNALQDFWSTVRVVWNPSIFDERVPSYDM
jgi:hypothetical protein